jgi:hypothetical protein
MMNDVYDSRPKRMVGCLRGIVENRQKDRLMESREIYLETRRMFQATTDIMPRDQSRKRSRSEGLGDEVD